MSSHPTLPFGSEEVLARLAHLWREARKSSLPDQPQATTLLRLAVLRDVFRALHAQKSRCLATGMKEQAQALKFWEARLEELRGADLSLETLAEPRAYDGDDLFAILGTQTPLKKRSRVIPQGLFSAIEREKLERYDRVWENALTAEAASIGWRFWRLEAWVSIQAIEAWNARLTEALWPDGIVLFVESAGFEETSDPEKARWQGQWTVSINPRFKTAQEIGLDFHGWPGQAGNGHSWKSLFTPPPPPRKTGHKS